MCDADLIVCIFKRLENFIPEIMLRSGAFANGVAMALCSKNHVTISDIKGSVSFSATSDIAKTKIKIEKDYHLISSRQRGLYREFNSGY